MESNDSVTTVIATGERRFKNKTPISQWEANLQPHFVRIHRSYLVNRKAVTGVDVDILYVGDSVWDYQCARDSGAGFVGISRGENGHRKWERVKERIDLIENISDVLSFL